MPGLRFTLAIIISFLASSFAIRQERKLVWSDEFTSPGLPDVKKWNYETGYIRNKEMQYYTKERKENARVEDGNLIIEARLDSFQVEGKTVPITSACLNTQGIAEWRYGRIEVRAKIPSALGTWPAIWMLGADRKNGGWPKAGEIDIMENVGFDPENIHTNIHTEAYNHVKKTNKGKATPFPKAYENFHIYAVEWTEEKMDFYLDDKMVFSFSNEHSGNATWPYDKPFYLILNLAFGGSWGGQKGVDLKALPVKFYIDYVRVYQ